MASGGAAAGAWSFPARCAEGWDGTPRDRVTNFAYGSNLDPAKMTERGLAPLGPPRRAVLKGWRLSFDMVAYPPCEPCFANVQPCGHTTPYQAAGGGRGSEASEGSSSSCTPSGEPSGEPMSEVHGVLYDLIFSDCQALYNGEGGGSSYHPVAVDVHLYSGEPRFDGDDVSGDRDRDGDGNGGNGDGGGRKAGDVRAVVFHCPPSHPRVAAGGGRDLPPSERYHDLVVGGASASGLDAPYVVALATVASHRPSQLGRFLYDKKQKMRQFLSRHSGGSGLVGPVFRLLYGFEAAYSDALRTLGVATFGTPWQPLAVLMLVPCTVAWPFCCAYDITATTLAR